MQSPEELFVSLQPLPGSPQANMARFHCFSTVAASLRCWAFHEAGPAQGPGSKWHMRTLPLYPQTYLDYAGMMSSQPGLSAAHCNPRTQKTKMKKQNPFMFLRLTQKDQLSRERIPLALFYRHLIFVH